MLTVKEDVLVNVAVLVDVVAPLWEPFPNWRKILPKNDAFYLREAQLMQTFRV